MNRPKPLDRLFQDQIEQYLQHYLQVDYLLLCAPLPNRESYKDVYRTALTEVLEPIQELAFQPGKRWRPAITLLHALLPSGAASSSEIFGSGRQSATVANLAHTQADVFLGTLATLVELLHNATLIADDIEDNAELRRGIPALHLSYGLDRALNACNWAYFLPSALLQPLERAGSRDWVQDLERLFSRCLSQIHLGQALDIRWHRQHNYIPTLDEYFCMATLKTGALFGFSAEAGILLSQVLWPDQAPVPAGTCRDLWRRIGRIFQALDDMQNIALGSPGKLRGDDWLEGKKSFPICLFVHEGEDQDRNIRLVNSLMRYLADSPAPIDLLDEVLETFIDSARPALFRSLECLQKELSDCRLLSRQL
ncbi:MAG: polyprenyl synthetase family protein, partial [Spirochaetota bacterium]